MQYTDIHAHLADPRILDDADDIIADSVAHGVTGVLATAARVGEWAAIRELALRHDIVKGALGLHPFFIDEWDESLIPELRHHAAESAPIIAIGEIGLDFYHGRTQVGRQVAVFAAQLELACELRRPVVLHNRKSWGEFLSVWRSTAAGKITGVCHHFTGSAEIARQLLDAGLYISFCGPLTYPNARRIKEAAVYVPLDRILTETDTPDLPAEPWRDSGQSRPWHVQAVVAEIARLKDVSLAEVAHNVGANYKRLLLA